MSTMRVPPTIIAACISISFATGQTPARVVPPARIVSFTAQRASIQPGQAVTLIWATENPNGVTIEPGVGRVTARGSRQLFPTTTTSYTLNVTGPNNTSLNSSVKVIVSGTAAAPTTTSSV